MEHIKKENLIHGAYYEGECRNASIARWNGITQAFYHYRTKFGHTYVEAIKCPEDDEVWDVFYAFEKLEENEVDGLIPFTKEDC